MQFGLFYEWPNPNLRDWKTLFEEGVEQIQYSEALGFDYCLIAEHHFTTYTATRPRRSCRPSTSDSARVASGSAPRP